VIHCEKYCNSQTCDFKSFRESQKGLDTKKDCLNCSSVITTDWLTDRQWQSDLNLDILISVLKMEALCFFRMLATTCETAL